MVKDELGTRMKEFYEQRAESMLSRRTPVIIRIDGRAFHTLTKKFKRPFDTIFSVAMQLTAESLCTEISGAQGAYVQSDEISILVQDYATLHTDAWFDYRVQKMASVAAGLATMYFNKHFSELVRMQGKLNEDSSIYKDKYSNVLTGSFDARCFNVPKEEVVNYFIWRQQDCTRNSILSVAQSQFSHKEMQGKKCNMLQDMLFTEKGINWNDLEIWKKRGTFIKRGADRKWFIDRAMPVITEDKSYINKLVYIEEQ